MLRRRRQQLRPSENSADRRNSIRVTALVGAVIVVAAVLRVYGLRWGLPSATHQYSYHPDEFLTVGAAFYSIYLARSFDPRFYNYPSLYLYLSALAMAVALGYGASPDIYLFARVVTAITGVAAVAVTYWAGRTLLNEACGLVAACVLCIAPLHVQHSHFATVDVPGTLFVAAALGYAGLVLKRGDLRDYLLGGAVAGLAAGTKYNAALVALSLVAAHCLRSGGVPKSIASWRLWAMLGCAVGAFVLSTPGSVLRTAEFAQGVAYEMRHAAQGHGLVFAGTGNGFVYTFTNSLWYGLGPAIAILSLGAGVWALFTRNRPMLVVLALVVPYYALISVSQVRFARYALPMFPGLALLCGWMAVDVWSRLRSRRARWLCRACVGVAGLAIIGTLCYTLALGRLFVLRSPQDRAAAWILGNLPKASGIVFVDAPWFYSPPLSKNLGWGSLSQREQAARDCDYKLTILADVSDPDWWRTAPQPPAVVITTDYELGDALRLRGDRSLRGDQARQLASVLSKTDSILPAYPRRRIFRSPLRFCGLSFGSTASLPHDMRYPAPTITLHYGRSK